MAREGCGGKTLNPGDVCGRLIMWLVWWIVDLLEGSIELFTYGMEASSFL